MRGTVVLILEEEAGPHNWGVLFAHNSWGGAKPKPFPEGPPAWATRRDRVRVATEDWYRMAAAWKLYEKLAIEQAPWLKRPLWIVRLGAWLAGVTVQNHAQ